MHLTITAALAIAAVTAAGARPPVTVAWSPIPTQALSSDELVVCADPNNLPFSNSVGQGFENKLVSLLARDLGMHVRYVWWAQRRGFIRNTMTEGNCDLWPGISAGVEKIATTHPYYRSTYVFVTRADKPMNGLTLDDERLRKMSIGVQLVGYEGMNTPPAHALARRGLTQNVRGYMLYGDYTQPNPPSAIVAAVARGDIDVALAWGPLAGYFAGKSSVPLRVQAVIPQTDAMYWPMSYDICVGVRRDKPQLLDQIDELLTRDRAEIHALLRKFHVPQAPDIPVTATTSTGDTSP